MFDNAKWHVYGRGSCGPIVCAPSEELLVICEEYACDADGLALPTLFGDGAYDMGHTPYEDADTAYLSCAGGGPRRPDAPVFFDIEDSDRCDRSRDREDCASRGPSARRRV